MTVTVSTTGAARLPSTRGRIAKASLAILIATTAMAVTGQATAATQNNGLFRTDEKKSSRTAAFKKWHRAIDRFHDRNNSVRNQPQMRRWKAFIRRTRRLSRIQQLRAVHRFVNGFAYRTDRRNYGRADYWATPSQFFARGGDCEDFAIVKYLTLKKLGWSVNRMRLVVLFDKRLRQNHAVLAVFHGGRRYILDNQFRAVMRDTQIRHYRPIYSINERNWWRHSGFQTARR